jgi:hypothetical protein
MQKLNPLFTFISILGTVITTIQLCLKDIISASTSAYIILASVVVIAVSGRIAKSIVILISFLLFLLQNSAGSQDQMIIICSLILGLAGIAFGFYLIVTALFRK